MRRLIVAFTFALSACAMQMGTPTIIAGTDAAAPLTMHSYQMSVGGMH